MNPIGASAASGRQYEERLLDLCASGETDPAVWRDYGDSFTMAGLAMLLASASGFDRQHYIELAECLHPGISEPEVLERWLERAVVSPARFLPLLRQRRRASKASST